MLARLRQAMRGITAGAVSVSCAARAAIGPGAAAPQQAVQLGRHDAGFDIPAQQVTRIRAAHVRAARTRKAGCIVEPVAERVLLGRGGVGRH